jgi:signal transduction histidine kinase
LALPACWKESEPEQIAGELLDVLIGLLRLDCAYVQLKGGKGTPPFSDSRPIVSEPPGPIADALQRSLAGEVPGLQIIARDDQLRLVSLGQRMGDERVAAVAGSARPGFPDNGEIFLLRAAVGQAVIAFHGAAMLVRERGARLAEERAAYMQARPEGLLEEKQWLAALLDLLPVPLLLLEPGTSVVSLANKAAHHAAGGRYPTQCPAEEWWYADVNGERIPESQTPCARAARGEELRGFQADWRTPSGTRSLLFSSQLLVAAHGHPATVLLAFEDVTELRKTQAALRVALAETSKFVSVAEGSSDFVGIAGLDQDVLFVNRQGQVAHDLTEQKRSWELRERLLGIVGHDLRNPLSSIMMGASLLQHDPPDETRQKTAKRIESSAQRMDAIIRDLLDLTKARLGGGIEVNPRPSDGHALCERVVEELRVAHPDRRIRLAMEGDAAGRWDPDRLEQVVSNLVGNALQHGAPESLIAVDSKGTASEWTVSVHNQGEPIPPELLPLIFDPFKSGGSGVQGRSLGLGLFIVREIVQAHGGTVEVSSAPNTGTRFLARLPRWPVPAS